MKKLAALKIFVFSFTVLYQFHNMQIHEFHYGSAIAMKAMTWKKLMVRRPTKQPVVAMYRAIKVTQDECDDYYCDDVVDFCNDGGCVCKRDDTTDPPDGHDVPGAFLVKCVPPSTTIPPILPELNCADYYCDYNIDLCKKPECDCVDNESRTEKICALVDCDDYTCTATVDNCPENVCYCALDTENFRWHCASKL